MKLTRRNKTILQVVGIAIVIVLTIILMFFPNLIHAGNGSSIKEILTKKDTLVSLNEELEMIDNDVVSSKGELETILKELTTVEEDTTRLKNGIKETNFDFHLPSIMVSLEQEAKKNDLEFSLDYANIQKANGSDSSEDPEMGEEFDEEFDEEFTEDYDEEFDEPEIDEGMGGEDGEDVAEENEVDEEDSEENLDENDENNENGENEGEDSSEENDDKEESGVDISKATEGLPSIPGVNITTVPITLKGNYSNVRSFIEYLDEIDLLENNIIDLKSNGKEITAVIVFNIFHVDEDLGGEDD